MLGAHILEYRKSRGGGGGGLKKLPKRGWLVREIYLLQFLRNLQ